MGCAAQRCPVGSLAVCVFPGRVAVTEAVRAPLRGAGAADGLCYKPLTATRPNKVTF